MIKHKNNLSICILLLLTFSLGCSSVSIKKNVVGKEAKTIQNWTIGYLPIPEKDTTGYYLIKEFQPILDLNSIHQNFIEIVYQEMPTVLRNWNDELIGSSGTIILSLNPSKTVSFPNTRYIIQKFEKEHCCPGEPYRPYNPIVMIDKNAKVDKIKSKQKVSEVRLYAYNSKKQLIGEILVTGRDIKPEHIAKLIKENIIK